MSNNDWGENPGKTENVDFDQRIFFTPMFVLVVAIIAFALGFVIGGNW